MSIPFPVHGSWWSEASPTSAQPGAGGDTHQVVLGSAAEQPPIERAASEPGGEAGMRRDPFVEDALRVMVHRGEVPEVHRQRDARGAGVARERVHELVFDQGELGPVRLRPGGVGEPAEVPVVHGARGRLSDLLGGSDVGGHERRATVGADDDARRDRVAASDRRADDPIAVPKERRDRRPLAERTVGSAIARRINRWSSVSRRTESANPTSPGSCGGVTSGVGSSPS